MALKPEFPDLPNMTPEAILEALAKAGLTNDEIAATFGMSPDQFDGLLNRRPNLYDILQEAKSEPNYKVEKALFKRALGYKIKEVTKENGRPTKVVLKEIAPDPVSCIFWLKNRDPKKWRDVVEMKFSLRDRMDRAHSAISNPPERKGLPSKTE